MHLSPIKPPPIYVSHAPTDDRLCIDSPPMSTCHYDKINSAVKKYQELYQASSKLSKSGSHHSRGAIKDHLHMRNNLIHTEYVEESRIMYEPVRVLSGGPSFFHSSARRPFRQVHLNLEALNSSSNAWTLRRISSTPLPREHASSGGVLRRDEALLEEVPPPDHAPPQPPPVLALPNVVQMPSAYTFSIEPPRAIFTTEGGMSRHVLVNRSPDRFAIKVRCSDNYHFRINPVFSFLDAGSIAELEVIRLQGGQCARDRLEIIYRICRASDFDAPSLFGLDARTRKLSMTLSTV